MYSLQDINKITGLPVRTIRYYIQKNLVDKPEGARKTATYGQQHLEQADDLRLARRHRWGVAARHKCPPPPRSFPPDVGVNGDGGTLSPRGRTLRTVVRSRNDETGETR